MRLSSSEAVKASRYIFSNPTQLHSYTDLPANAITKGSRTVRHPRIEMQEGAMAGDASKDMDLQANRIEWRSRYNPRPPDLREQFTDQFHQNQDVYVTGARGSAGPFKVDEVLGNGRYKLRKQDGEKMKKTYDEGDLSGLPKTIT